MISFIKEMLSIYLRLLLQIARLCYNTPIVRKLLTQANTDAAREEDMSVEKVKAFFAQYQMADRIVELNESSATVELAAEALHTQPCRIAKTMSFMVANQAVLIVTAGDMKIDNSKFKSYFHEKARMLTPQELDTLVGHAPGGVCPFAVPDTVKTYLDVSMKRFKTVFPAAGSSNSCIELSLADLEKYSKCIEWIDVCKTKEVPAAAN